ncbi:hypothetical protein [Bradyrhizobium sp. NBAIM02]|uniref:hypothetical protein n=1 Tax=Bradyrhizobium sp. NBAIM02 TaxID=2793817 RepID=UPI001CD4FBDD|nr:hypothetical protein [Bradyrhizobium sp. NBAIM02]MCA1503819.1 hypothetical protein [Bradyrhizobium sp. NBAIM02]
MMPAAQELMQRLAQASERAGGGNLIERLRAAKAGKPRADLSHLDDPAFWRRIGGTPTLDGGDDFDAEDEAARPTQARRKRHRKANITALIKRVRKAGERGPVRIEMIGGDGGRTIITSSSDPAPDAMSEDEAEKMWHERIGKDATH